jgi:hypothetical protein
MINASAKGRKRGRVPGPKTDRYQVLLSPELAEWGKQQAGGLSGFLRRLMENARAESEVFGGEGAAFATTTPPTATPKDRLLGFTIPGALNSIAEAVRASRSVLDLKDDWDGEGSPSYDEAVWERAGRFVLNNALQLWRESGRVIRPPDIFPGPDGSVDLLWESGEATLLVNVPPQPDMPVKWFGSLKDGTESTKGTMDASGKNLRLMTWLVELASPET